ncbi:ketosynthase chain-length factor [Streptomyces sp. NPDC008313]|uniref:ketosynthase chain-length factor n=1 Tax=Streptomyces sp. NPDC008313 TaxID=3364826 RepID=UPI0036E8CD6A
MTAVAVTGIGAIASNGQGTEEYWKSTVEGIGGIAGISRFDASGYPAKLAGEVTFDAAAHLPSRLIPATDHMTRLALAAADWALDDAAVRPSDLDDFSTGVITAGSAGGFELGQRELENLWSKGAKYVSVYQSYAWFYAVNSGQISIRHGMRGPSGVVVGDHAGGLDAIAQSRRQIRKGTRLIVSGAVDGSLCPWGWVAQMTDPRMSTAADPREAYLPFDPRAGGYVPGEGGALLVMEDLAHARERGARIYGEIAGYGATTDPAPGSSREPGLRRALTIALDDADVSPDDVDVVFADAAAVPELDRVEVDALNRVFGAGRVPVTAPKTMTGRPAAGTAALDVAGALLAIRDGVIPPTVNVSRAPGYDIDLVTGSARRAPVRTAVVLARGHGGFNSALVVRGTR